MRVLVTGASGLVGRSLMRLLAASSRHEGTGPPRAALDVTDRAGVERALRDWRPEVVIHCAAYTDVDGAERDGARAMAVNADGAEHVARAAMEVGARLVYVSSDYVFDGEKKAAYTEEDLPRPLSLYGRSKLEGERRVEEICGGSRLIVRTSWLYGAGKGFVDAALQRMEEAKSLRFVDDQVGSPTWSLDLARALLSLVERGERGVYHFANRGQASWLDLARRVAVCAGRADLALQPMSLSEMARPARRPRFSALAVGKFERLMGASVVPWQRAVESYLAERAQRAAGR